MEAALTALLKTKCVRTFPDVAPVDTVRPYVTYQHIGGDPLRFVDNTASDSRWTMVQINTWADSRAAALLLARQIEDAMCASTDFVAEVQNEPIGSHEADFVPARYGCIQDFKVLAAR